ncbi:MULTISPECIES: 3-phosphoshikimate 1-carboxyvinyltransferase [Streptomyces]|uniref:3-phosphoshikimate 1-carboxyvinyltransferase n=1 Tax=Streptomyces eurythermus TaxID=42237 RepID=A0ABW6Z9E8_9ACTN|nr:MULTISPECIES: 3-phosphoshikimate 1-carboxyvinyltransferase [Streptomyces]QIS75126.1 3-phosphoshikimate 1-carboxyvinyltransferase [Streptomyces sp. DSM 40868]
MFPYGRTRVIARRKSLMAPAVSDSDLDAVSSLQVTGAGPARGLLQVPGDKSISHRAVLMAAMAHGPTVITGLSMGQDVTHTLGGVQQFGVSVTSTDDGRVRVEGPIRHEPADILDHGNAGTGIRLTAGVCAGIDGVSVLTGDRFLRRRPMDRIAEPLRTMGARVDGRERGRLAPLVIRGGRLTGITYSPKQASAQVKSALLLAGLSAAGPTTVEEVHPTRRHTEEMLTQFGGRVRVEGNRVTVEPGDLTGTQVVVPGDPSQAAFWAVAALLAPEHGEVVVENLYTGFGRSDFVNVLERMGADIDFDLTTGTLTVKASRLRAVDLTAEDIPGIVDEVPALAMAAAVAEGTTVISGAGELRAKESDRIASTARLLRAFGVQVSETEDGMVIEGGSRLRAGRVDSHGDHRIAMTAAVAAACVEGTTVIDGWESVATSYPGFAADLVRLTGASAQPGA